MSDCFLVALMCFFKSLSIISSKTLHRDYFKRPLPISNMHLLIDTILKIFNLPAQSVSFINKGREGEIIYKEGIMSKIRFYVSYGGNDVVLYVSIPSASDWEKTTLFPLNRRSDILHFVASQTQKYQAPSCIYEIYDNSILFKSQSLSYIPVK